MNNNRATENGRSVKQYSDRYTAIRKEAESKWPAWKVSTYNTSIAVSRHAKKVGKEATI